MPDLTSTSSLSSNSNSSNNGVSANGSADGSADDSTFALPDAEHDRNREAFESTEAERNAIDEKDVVMPNLDVISSISTASAAMPTIRGLREQIKTLPGVDMEQFDRLQTYAWGLLFAHLAHAAAMRPHEPLPEMAARAAKKRELLNSDIAALVKRGVIDGKQLDQLRGGVSYRNIALDLQLLVFILRQHWSAIVARSMITEDELKEAQSLGQELFDAVNGRQRTTAAVLKATSDRSRAFLLFVRAYDEVRRAVTFLRWHEGDADALVPSLYAGRSGSKSEAEKAPSPAPVAPVEKTPVAPSPVVIPGQPGGSPFLG